MDVEYEDACSWDSVEVRLNDVDDSGEKFCGTTLPPVQMSSGDRMTIRFTSDGATTGRGFRATYVIIDNGGGSSISSSSAYSSSDVDYSSSFGSSYTEFVGTCGGVFGGQRGSLASPNYPANYDNNLECVYVIEVEPNHHVALNLVDFALQNHPSCTRDVLEINLGEGIRRPLG